MVYISREFGNLVESFPSDFAERLNVITISSKLALCIEVIIYLTMINLRLLFSILA
jgi:hypothetical protein